MHGTVEWLPGSPLGSTADSWPGKTNNKCSAEYDGEVEVEEKRMEITVNEID